MSAPLIQLLPHEPGSGWSLGDIAIHGNRGSVESAGRVPDQSSMVYHTAVELLDTYRRSFRPGQRSKWRVVATDSSFTLAFGADSKGVVTLTVDSAVVHVAPGAVLAGDLVASVAPLLTGELVLPPGDPVAADLSAADRDFRDWWPTLSG